MRARTALVLTVAAAAGVSGALTLRRRYATLQATGSLNPDVDLSGAPFGPPMRPPASPPTGDARVLPPPWEPPALTALASWTPAAARSPLGRALAYAWAAPITVVGALLGLASGSRPEFRDGVLVFPRTGGAGGALLRARGFQATALGHAVLATGDPDADLMAHELVHVRHAERLGLFSALLYGLLYPAYGYARHPMERAARAAARRQRGAPA